MAVQPPPQLEISEELLKLLRGLNKKLEKDRSNRSPLGDVDAHEAESEAEDNTNASLHTTLSESHDRFCWYKNTHRGQDWIAEIPLPESRPRSPVADEDLATDTGVTDNESYDILKKYRPEEHTWGYLYKSSFRHRAEELSFMGDTIAEETGIAWAIPEDGRSSLTLSLRGLELEKIDWLNHNDGLPSDLNDQKIRWSGCDSKDPAMRDKILSSLRELGKFNRDLHKSEGRSFLVTDFDPWNDECLTYKLGEPITQWFGKPAEEPWGQISWNNQDQKVMCKFSDRYPQPGTKQIFDPLCLTKGLQFIKKDDDTYYNIRSNQIPVFYTAPWRRLVLIQGLASMPVASSPGVGLPGCPYLGDRTDWEYSHGDDESGNWSQAVKMHLSCERTPGNASSNPYSEAYPFQIVFYEQIDGSSFDELSKSQWKIGRLFEDSPADEGSYLLRRSAFTVSKMSMPSFKYSNCTYMRNTREIALDPFYTVLLLLPEGFRFKDGEESFQKYKQYKMLRLRTALQCELSCIVKGLAQVIKRWTKLDQYLGNLLVEDFMDPKQYATLLFDDENFTRSRKYFWAIGCLNEFIVSIADNIKQWDMYHEARLKEFTEPEPEWANTALSIEAASVLPLKYIERNYRTFSIQSGESELNSIRNMIRKGDNHREALANLKAQFESKLETVKALRDGLFNASALVESRASTRLGENVKLLTYVSIFYLPLAFCAALWAIPNINVPSTKIPFTITAIIVGAITYAIVFNIDSLTSAFTKRYYRGRDVLVREMQEESGWWRGIGTRFEEFKPSAERRVPTEWLVPLYAARRLFRWGGKEERKVEGPVKINEAERSEDKSDEESTAYVGDHDVVGPDRIEAEEKRKIGLLSRLRRGRGKKETTSV